MWKDPETNRKVFPGRISFHCDMYFQYPLDQIFLSLFCYLDQTGQYGMYTWVTYIVEVEVQKTLKNSTES